jgi:hypothetical protein
LKHKPHWAATQIPSMHSRLVLHYVVLAMTRFFLILALDFSNTNQDRNSLDGPEMILGHTPYILVCLVMTQTFFLYNDFRSRFLKHKSGRRLIGAPKCFSNTLHTFLSALP